MPGDLDAPEPVAAARDDVAVKQAFVVVGHRRGHGNGRVGPALRRQFLLGKALGPAQKGLLVHAAAPLDLGILLQQPPVYIPDVDVPPLPRGYLGGQSGVVGVQVGQQYVGLLRMDAQLPQPGKQSPAAGFLAKPGVHHQRPVAPLDDIAVEFLQRVPRQGHRDPVKILPYFFRHRALLELFV